MPSTALVGESLFYEVAKVLSGTNAISYYQYKAIEELLNMLAFHERAAVLVGDEADDRYLAYFDWLISKIHEDSDFQIDLISAEHRNEWITNMVMARFDDICREIYGHSLGITKGDLFSKQPKDRTAEDMSEHLEQMFIRDFPVLLEGKFAEEVYELWVRNATSSEILYFLRAHLIQAMSEIHQLTPMFENQRLMAGIMQVHRRVTNRVGCLPYEVYDMTNKSFMKVSDAIRSNQRADYPRPSIAMLAVISKTTTRQDILNSAIRLRSELTDFRRSYGEAEEILTDANRSLAEQSEIRSRLDASANLIWTPIMATLGRGYSSSKIIKAAKAVFGKYGVGEIKLEHSDKTAPEEDESSVNYSTSLIGLGTAIVKSISEVRNEAKLIGPNKPLIDVLLSVVELTDVKQIFSSILPLRDFGYKVPQLIDSQLVETEGGVK
jgi:hypothetical protein